MAKAVILTKKIDGVQQTLYPMTTPSQVVDPTTGKAMSELMSLDSSLFEAVTELPVSNIKEGKIYLIQTQTPGEYTQWVYDGSSWDDSMGTIDLSTLGISVAVEDTTPDFEIADESDNVLLRISQGQLQVQRFASGDIEVLASRVNRYRGKVLSILGDSISTFGTPDQSNATGTYTYPGNRCRYPQSNLFTNVRNTYWYRLMEATGMVLGINESWAGSFVSNNQASDSGDKGPNRCISSLTRIGHLGENGTPDVIVVYAGTNDIAGNVSIGTFDRSSPQNYTEEEIAALSVTTFAGAYRAMLIRLLYYYPSSRVIVCFPNFTESYYSTENLDNYIEIIREACDYFGVEYIDLRTAGITMYNRDTYLPDGIHPGVAGMELLYNKLYNQLIFA